jgi:hypothetical protein
VEYRNGVTLLAVRNYCGERLVFESNKYSRTNMTYRTRIIRTVIACIILPVAVIMISKAKALLKTGSVRPTLFIVVEVAAFGVAAAQVVKNSGFRSKSRRCSYYRLVVVELIVHKHFGFGYADPRVSCVIVRFTVSVRVSVTVTANFTVWVSVTVWVRIRFSVWG